MGLHITLSAFTMDMFEIATIVGLAITIFTIVIRLEKRFGDIDKRVVSLENKIEPFWEIIKNNLSKILIGNPTKEILEQINKGDKLTKKEIDNIKIKLTEEMNKTDIPQKINFLFALWYLETLGREKC